MSSLEQELAALKEDWSKFPGWLCGLAIKTSLLGNVRPVDYIAERGEEGLRNYFGLEARCYGELNPLFTVMEKIIKERDRYRQALAETCEYLEGNAEQMEFYMENKCGPTVHEVEQASRVSQSARNALKDQP